MRSPIMETKEAIDKRNQKKYLEEVASHKKWLKENSTYAKWFEGKVKMVKWLSKEMEDHNKMLEEEDKDDRILKIGICGF